MEWIRPGDKTRASVPKFKLGVGLGPPETGGIADMPQEARLLIPCPRRPPLSVSSSLSPPKARPGLPCPLRVQVSRPAPQFAVGSSPLRPIGTDLIASSVSPQESAMKGAKSKGAAKADAK